jgi:transcriptional regulator with XRE-family HTH domain
MVASKKSTFGALVRREREAKKIGLREMARMIGISPTYLSKIERDEFLPPAEEKVKAIAKIIDHDADELLALAGKVSSDLTEIIRRQPREMASILRSVRQPRATNETSRLSEKVRRAKKP